MTDRLVLLGVAGGTLTDVKPTNPPTANCGISSALVIGDRIYIVDTGQSSARQLSLADPLGRSSARVFADIAAVFITHLHADHTMDLNNYVLAASNQGWPDGSVPVFGPWSRVIDETGYPGVSIPAGTEPTSPGAAEFVSRLLAAFEADSHDREYAAGKSPLSARMHGVDLEPPDGVYQGAPQPVPSWPVFEDDRVRVSATLVEHGTMYPALAFRFDTDAWSVTFSGDTQVSDSLVELARGSDILVHELVDPLFGERVFGPPPHTPGQRKAAAVVVGKHTTPAQVGLVATAAQVKTLVISHMTPANLPEDYWREGITGFDGEIVIGTDLATFELPGR